MTQIITRFAPSPTGNLHIGSARTALINYIVSRQNSSSKFYIRIEDTDKERSKEEFTNNILSGLKWLGIKWENEIQIQSKRISRHQQVALELLKKKLAYKCVCSLEKLNLQRELIKTKKNLSKKICINCKNNKEVQELTEGFVIRIKLPDDGSLSIEDKVQGKVSVMNKELDDFILLRKDNTPTYMLSVVVDDNDIGVNFIIRGDDHLNNTFRQYYIYKYLNWNLPKYAHIPLIHGEDGAKLSKRHGAVNVLDFRDNGYLPESIINNLILLGWSPGKDNEYIEISEIIKSFDLNKLSKSSSIFNYKKLNFFNNYYLRKDNGIEKLIEFGNYNDKFNKLISENKDKIISIFNVYKKDLENLGQILEILDIYLGKNFKINQNEKFDDNFNDLFKEFYNCILNIENWNRENIQKNISDFLIAKNIKFPVLGKPIRFLLINSYNGPSISDIFVILGKKDSIDRLNQYIQIN